MFIQVLIGAVIILLSYIYCNGKYNEMYWTKRGVTFYKNNKVLGVFWDFLVKDKSLAEILNDVYKEYPDEPAIGIGTLLTPTLYVKDITNIQHVLATNFKAFSYRGINPNEDDILANNILSLNGNKWQLIRKSMTPLFTSTKLKSMFYIMEKSAQDYISQIKENPKLKSGDAFNNLSSFCSAAICATVFGVTTESIFDSPFLTMAKQTFDTSIIRNFQITISVISETLFKLFNIQFFTQFEPFFVGAIKQTVRQRERENVKKHDFVDMCVSIQSKGTLKDPVTGYKLEPSDEVLAAQAFFFFLAGVLPSTSTMFTIMVELGRNLDVQQRLQKEIDEAFEKNDNKLSYDVVVGMEYLNMVISEAMRLHPPIGFLNRKCNEDTILPVGNIKVSKGTIVLTPIFELHHDPKYFPNPEVFDPERFSRKNQNNISDIIYHPFGKGNRICIGMRYAQLQVKTGLIYLLRNFSVKTIISNEGIKYKKDQVIQRLVNVDVDFVLRT